MWLFLTTLLFSRVFATVVFKETTGDYIFKCIDSTDNCSLHANIMDPKFQCPPYTPLCVHHSFHVLFTVQKGSKKYLEHFLSNNVTDLRPRTIPLSYSGKSLKTFQEAWAEQDSPRHFLHLSCSNLTDDQFVEIAQSIETNSKIVGLTIKNSKGLSNTSFQLLGKALAKSTTITELCFQENDLKTEKISTFLSAYAPNRQSPIKTLGLMNEFKITGSDLSLMIQAFSFLETLDVLRSFKVAQLVLTKDMPSLNSVAINECPNLILKDFAISMVAHCRALKHLSIDSFTNDTENAKAVAQLSGLESLSLARSPMYPGTVDDEALKDIAANMPNLKTLDFKSKTVTNDGAKELTKLSQLTDLTIIDSEKITADLLKEFLDKRQPPITNLNLSGCWRLSFNVPDVVNFIKESPTLEQLTIIGLVGRHDSNRQKLLQSLFEAYEANSKIHYLNFGDKFDGREENEIIQRISDQNQIRRRIN